MLAGMLTHPPDYLVLHEPNFAGGARHPDQLGILQRFGYSLDRADFDRDRKAHSWSRKRARISRLYAPLVDQLAGWGVKEVSYKHQRDNLDLLQPRRVVVLVRDLRDVALSYLDLKAKLDAQGIKSALTPRHLVRNASILLDLSRKRTDTLTVVRYEDMVADSRVVLDLTRWLDWRAPGEGSDLLALMGRSDETSKHAQSLSARSVRRHQHETDPAKLAFAEQIARRCRGYQENFGYGSPQRNAAR